MLDKEYWKPIDGYNNKYFISKIGMVYKCDREDYYLRLGVKTKRIKYGGLLKEHFRRGYPSVTLFNGRKHKHETIHRLVASHFNEKQTGKDFINHENGIKTDSYYKNLSWCTPKENHDHAIRTGLDKGIVGENNSNSKLNELQVRIIRRLIGNLYQREIAEIFNIKQTIVSKIKLRQLWGCVNQTYKIKSDKPCKGSKKSIAKLSEEKVLEIRNLSGLKHREIAKLYNVSTSTITQVINRDTWTHI